MLEFKTFVDEFVAVASFCIEEESGYYIKDGKFFAVERVVIEELLDRNKYEESAAKLALWKRLHWIDTDADSRHTTKSVYIKAELKSKRMIVIDLSVHGELTRFCNKDG